MPVRAIATDLSRRSWQAVPIGVPGVGRRRAGGVFTLLGLSVLSALTWPGRAAAQERRSDVQVWTSISGTAALGRDAEVRVDGLLQLADDASRDGRELARVVLLARLDDRVKLGGGYVWTRIAPVAGVQFVEHRAVQEVDFRSPIWRDRIVLSLRWQMEERRRQGLGGTSLRWRQLTRLEFPVGRKVRAVVWDEYFHELQKTAWSGRAGPSLMLNFVGVHLPVTRTIAIEPGYLNQTQFDRGPNRVRHAAALFATVRF